MPSAPAVSPRVRRDACPGALSVHQAADGGLARVRLPGGVLAADQLRVLTAASCDLGDGVLELTSRGNVQIRALAAGAEIELGSRLARAGLLPSLTHERVRNIVASPLGDVAGLVAALDSALCARPRLAELPGRFLFAIDDGSGDMASLGADVRYVLGAEVLLPGGFAVPRAVAVDAMLAVAEAFLDERAAQSSGAWRISELVGGADVVVGRLGDRWTRAGYLPPTTPDEPAGEVPGGLVALVPLGRLTGAQAQLLAAQTGDLRITPWRSVVLLDPAPGATAALDAAGLGVRADSPWRGITACTGRPGCASALADVQADARSSVLAGEFAGLPVHWSGCARRCGRPSGTIVDRIATGDGYLETTSE